MSRFDQYLRHTSQELGLAFEKLRAMSTDPGVKGSGNEAAVAGFIKSLFPYALVHQRVQVIDSDDRISDELDVVGSNQYQPFPAEQATTLLVEGVSFAIQVKAVLTRHEINRAAKNCESFKQLLPWHNVGDEAYKASTALQTEQFWQAPYICFAFSSELSAITILEELTSVSNATPDHQLDALFVLDRGWSFHNHRQGKPFIVDRHGRMIVGWSQTETGDQTLMSLLRFLHEESPHIVRKSTALTGYFQKANLPTRGLVKTVEPGHNDQPSGQTGSDPIGSPGAR